MGNFSDKFLNMLKLNDDDEYDEDDAFFEDDLDGRSVRMKKRRKDQTDTDEAAPKVSAATPAKTKPANKFAGKIVPVRNNSRSGFEVCVIKPSTVEDAREITDTLLSGRAVVLNLEGIHVDTAQRIIDFTSGSCYAINGNLQKISNYIFIVTPETVDISGDLQDILSGGFDVASFQSSLQ
ncbi:cell division protein SepF [Parasporobacterium paucivorans]|uniref:Cell division protein SepF n=1 Tax=Parasporobacterium paucivorans DSM 15970 TaxID=1122934 RepID=A0A1M6A3L9_9FIRM|nr:cell division protein SepF [Parasporobacterium paucivorans]SHI31062.1 cell division inhibitor SepF [Parasporobacterium paucivorans DSM 15970]